MQSSVHLRKCDNLTFDQGHKLRGEDLKKGGFKEEGQTSILYRKTQKTNQNTLYRVFGNEGQTESGSNLINF